MRTKFRLLEKTLLVGALALSTGCAYQTVTYEEVMKGEGLCDQYGGLSIIYESSLGSTLFECFSGERFGEKEFSKGWP